MKQNSTLSMKKASKMLNDLTYTHYYYRLQLIARSVFEWENLPDHIDEKWIEEYLYHNGCCMFFEDERLGLMVAKCNTAGSLNNYDEPTLLKPYATNYTSTKRYRNGKECVLIRNNDLMLPTDKSIRLFALRLAEITRTMDVNISAQKTSVMLVGSERERLSLKNLQEQWSENAIAVYVDKGMSEKPLQVLKTDAPVVFPQLRIEKNAIWNEVMTFLGVNNANQDKRERLVADEVDANNEQIEMSAAVMLKSREKACELINKLFPGQNVSVRLRKREELDYLLDGGDFDDQSELHGGSERSAE